MELSDLFERAQDDIEAAGNAADWAMKFNNWVEQRNETTPLAEIDEFQYWPNVSVSSGKINVFYVAGWRFGLPNDLDIGFGWRDDGESSERGSLMHFIAEGRRRYCIVLMVKDDPRQSTDVIWSVNPTTLEHEIVHYFDYKRGMEDAMHKRRFKNARIERETGKKVEPKPHTPKYYYNDSLELNAHFHQALTQTFSSLASNIAQSEVYAMKHTPSMLQSFAKFQQDFRKTLDQNNYNYWPYLSARNKQKFIRRLYKIYVMIKEQWPDIPAVRRYADTLARRWRERDAKETA